ncbi:MAG: hypothetical protein RBT80_16220 [Candidatus Vecturithrix sp.]|nr:hypothetical protein [Candidatus Vecturithrix sp.]
MLRWTRQISAGASGGLLMLLFAPQGEREILVLLILITGFWLCADRMPGQVRGLLRLVFLISYTGFMVNAIFAGIGMASIIVPMTGSLASWNIDMFLTRWPEVPLEQQRRYLRSLAAVMGVSMASVAAGAGLQGRLHLSLPIVLIIMVLAGVWALYYVLGLAKSA